MLPSGVVEYRRAGRLHNEQGPAREYPDGRREWWINDFPARLDDGPTIIEADGTRRWEGPMGLDRDDGPAVEHPDGGREYWEMGERHRTGAPAQTWADGSYVYWERNKRHRLDGPACRLPSGELQWRVEDVLHRLDGPAIVTARGVCLFYRDGMACPPPAASLLRGVAEIRVQILQAARASGLEPHLT